MEKEWNELSAETQNTFIEVNDETPYITQFLLACKALKQLKHKYSPDDNCVIIDRSDELENNNRFLWMFIGYRLHIREIYLEKEIDGELWSYRSKIDADNIKNIKKYEGITDCSQNCKYTFVNANYPDQYNSGRTASINGEEIPEYCCTSDPLSDSHFERYTTVYREHSYICKKDGKLLYFALGSDEYAVDKNKSAKVNIKSVEYKANGKNFRLELSDNSDVRQTAKYLDKLAENESVSVIRITTKADAEITIYGHSKCYFVSVKDKKDERYAKSEAVSTDRINKFGFDLPEICVIEMPYFLEDFLSDIVSSDFGYIRMIWLYPFDDCMKVDLPELNFSDAETVTLPEPKKKKSTVKCSGYTYRLSRCRQQALDEEKLSAMTAKKMYNLAVKKLETGKLVSLLISAVHNDENEKQLVIYGDGRLFSIGLIDMEEETALYYDNGSGDGGFTEFEGQTFPNTTLSDDIDHIRKIIEEFCENGGF